MGQPTQGTWDEAKTFCEGLVYEGYEDWVLPTIDQQKVLFAGCDSNAVVLRADEDGNLETTVYTDENGNAMICPISQGCASTDDGLAFYCGCDEPPAAANAYSCYSPWTCSECEELQGPGLDGYYTAPGYFGIQDHVLNCARNPFFTRTRRGSGAVTMQPEDGRIASGSQTAETKYFTCVREIGAVCGDGHVQTGEECDDGNDTDDDVCDNTCKRTM